LKEEDQEDERIEEDWIETEEEKLPIVCLLCSYQSGNFLEVLKHMDDDHRFNFQACTVNCDFYQKVLPHMPNHTHATTSFVYLIHLEFYLPG